MAEKIRWLATGKWSKERKEWQIVVAMPERPEGPGEGRKPPHPATVIPLRGSIRRPRSA